MKPLVSVIVPVYNVERYLGKCLESLVNQSLIEIEIIVVNDGSTDGSQKIIDEYKKDYPSRIFSYYKNNGGLSDARNFGLQYARAEYIGFVDSDDYVNLDMYQQMLSKAIETHSDIVVCDIVYEWENSSKSKRISGLHRIVGVETQKAIMLSPLFAWNKLYHRKFFDYYNFRYPIGLWYEDIPVTLPIFAHSGRIAYIESPLVHYLQRTSSIMSARKSDKLKDIFVVMTNVYEYFLECNLLDGYHEEVEYLFIEQLLIYGGFRFIRSDKPYDLFNEAFDLVCYFFPNWRKNKYIATLNLKNRVFIKTLSKQSFKIYYYLIRAIDTLKGRH